MSAPRAGDPTTDDPHARLEQDFIDEFLRERGYSSKDVNDLPEELARQLMTEASTYASCKLTEVEARARFVDEVHGVSPPL
jgi:hypothetical protein